MGRASKTGFVAVGNPIPKINTSTSVDVASGDAHHQPLTQQRQLSAPELEALKPVIKHLYIDKGLSFREVQTVLSTQYDYTPR